MGCFVSIDKVSKNCPQCGEIRSADYCQTCINASRIITCVTCSKAFNPKSSNEIYCEKCNKIAPYLIESWRFEGTQLYHLDQDLFWKCIMKNNYIKDLYDFFYNNFLYKYYYHDYISYYKKDKDFQFDNNDVELWCLQQIYNKTLLTNQTRLDNQANYWKGKLEYDTDNIFMNAYLAYGNVMNLDIQKIVANYLLKCQVNPPYNITRLLSNFKSCNNKWNIDFPDLIIKFIQWDDNYSTSILLSSITANQWNNQLLFKIYKCNKINYLSETLIIFKNTYLSLHIDLIKCCQQTLQQISFNNDAQSLNLIINTVQLMLPRKLIIDLLDNHVNNPELYQILKQHLESREGGLSINTNQQTVIQNQPVVMQNQPLINSVNNQINSLVSNIDSTIDELSLNDKSSCSVCQERLKNIIILPCRHQCLCATCTKNNIIVNCPICRTTITKFMQVYLS